MNKSRKRNSANQRSIVVFLFFSPFLLENAGNPLKKKNRKNICFSSFSDRPMQTLWRNTASRHRDNIYVY